ncbi:hypothetical protein STZ1_20602 [Bacillus subtilis]
MNIKTKLLVLRAKRLYSLFPEPALFEEFLPTGWVRGYKNFTPNIPEEERYWISVSGENVFEMQ